MIFPPEQSHSFSYQWHRCFQTGQAIEFSQQWNQQATYCPSPSVSLTRFKFRSQLSLFPQIKCLITFRLESSIISTDTDSSITLIWPFFTFMFDFLSTYLSTKQITPLLILVNIQNITFVSKTKPICMK